MVVLCSGASMRGAAADVSPLRKQLAVAEEDENKPAIIELSRRILAVTPNDSGLWEKLVGKLFEIEDYDRGAEALDAWQKAVKQPPATIEDFRGDLALKLKQYPEAEKHWLAFVARKPSPADAAATYDNLAELCADQARWADCASYYAKAIAAEDSAARRVAHGCVLLRLHQWDGAYIEMRKANRIDSTDPQVKEWLPQFERLSEFLPRIKALEAEIAKSPDDVDLLLKRARFFTLAERPLLALDDCERAMKLQPALMRARIQTAEALLDLKRADDAAKLQVSAVLTREVDLHVGEEKLRELAEEDAAIAQNSGKPEPLVARAGTLHYLHQYTLALVDARAALALDDKSAAAHLEAARDLKELQDSKEALSHAIKAAELNAAADGVWYLRGTLEAERADYAAAIESFTRSIKAGEGSDAREALEKCERRMGKIDKAKQ